MPMLTIHHRTTYSFREDVCPGPRPAIVYLVGYADRRRPDSPLKETKQRLGAGGPSGEA